MVCNVGAGTGVCLCSNDQVNGQGICVNSRYGTTVKQERWPGSQTSTSSSWDRCVELIDLCLGGPVQVWVL